MAHYEDFFINYFSDTSRTIEKKISSLMNTIVDLISDMQSEQLALLFTEIENMRYSSQAYLESLSKYDEQVLDKVFSAGYANALVEFMEQYKIKTDNQADITNIKTKYRDTVLYYLKQKGSLMHKDLAYILNVSPSHLNSIIQQINTPKIKLIHINEVSKFKILFSNLRWIKIHNKKNL